MSLRKDILINAANFCIAQSCAAEREYKHAHEVEFYHAMRGCDIMRRQMNASKRNIHGLAQAYATKAVQLIKAI